MLFFFEMILNDKDDNVKVIGLWCFDFFLNEYILVII